MKRYAVYKGLQRPLSFKGFKGKYIYYGVACLLAGLVSGALTMALISGWLGAVVLAGCTGGGLLYLNAKQKDGLHAKTRNHHIQVHPVQQKHHARTSL